MPIPHGGFVVEEGFRQDCQRIPELKCVHDDCEGRLPFGWLMPSPENVARATVTPILETQSCAATLAECHIKINCAGSEFAINDVVHYSRLANLHRPAPPSFHFSMLSLDDFLRLRHVRCSDPNFEAASHILGRNLSLILFAHRYLQIQHAQLTKKPDAPAISANYCCECSMNRRLYQSPAIPLVVDAAANTTVIAAHLLGSFAASISAIASETAA